MTFKKLIILASIFIGTGCASYTNQNNNLTRNEMAATHSFATMNKQIWGEHGLHNNDYLEFNITDYERILNKSKSDTAKEARDFYSSLSNKTIFTTADSYIICGYSSKYEIALCDDAPCETVEIIIKENSGNNIPKMRAQILHPGKCK